MVFHILADNATGVSVLDISLGTGDLAQVVRSNAAMRHWQVDGIDGFAVNCHNEELLYRNLWHGLAQELPSDLIA